MGTKRR